VKRRRWLIEPGSRTDLAALVELERLCSPHPWSESMIAAVLTQEAGECVILARAPLDSPSLLGYCVYRTVADEVHVHNIGVHPSARRRGLARLLLQCVLVCVSRAGARVAHLEVRAGNAPAIALYARLGFAPVGRRKDYYASPREDALLFMAPLPMPRPGSGAVLHS
jgi:[ribosomal protein S18]-alanine N-acetyltransferase